MNISFFWVFIFGHLIGDFVLQTNKIAKLKTSSKRGLFVHALIVALSQVAVLIYFGIMGVTAAIIKGIIHFFIDDLKNKFNGRYNSSQTLMFVADQLVHLVFIFILTKIFTNLIPQRDFNVFYVKFGVVLILLGFVSTILIKIVLRDIKKDLQKEAFFKKNERIIDGTIAVINFLICFIAFRYGIYFVFLLIPVYIVYKKYFSYNYQKSIINIKFVFLMVISGIFTLIV
jgi:hypothetical protein